MRKQADNGLYGMNEVIQQIRPDKESKAALHYDSSLYKLKKRALFIHTFSTYTNEKRLNTRLNHYKHFVPFW